MLTTKTLMQWEFTQLANSTDDQAKEDWAACNVPTSVHVQLRRLGRIPDPFAGLNEWDVQWIQEADWGFRTTFEHTASAVNADLVFEGLDTYCDVYLNGKLLMSADNMFVTHRVDARPALRKGTNELYLHFKAPWLAAKQEEAANGGKRVLWNGDSCRLYSRKAQYGWGWDWGPVMMTVGPWKPIRLETYDHRIEDVAVIADYVDGLGTLKGTAALAPETEEGWTIVATLRRHRDVVAQASGTTSFEFTLAKGSVEAWWPLGYGAQPMYDLDVAWLDAHGHELATHHQRVAFRHFELVQAPLDGQPGTSFVFEINGVRVFCAGANWIPADSFLTEVTRERYRRWVGLMVKANMCMLRVWGGGVYEDEALYDACDEHGILVWQDFMFGCGMYPSYPKFNESVKLEATQAVTRLRKHPSVVVFAGNNEDYQVAESLNLNTSDDKQFPARYIYEELLPAVVKPSGIAYHRGSPYGGKSSSDPTVGDIHQWNVWHGTQELWSAWPRLAGRFVSEFGMQGFPDRRTLAVTGARHPQDRAMANHNKAAGYERRIELYLVENFRYGFELGQYAYATQVMQAECLAAAYRAWRREWKGRGMEYVAGALVWQLNDCWPCVSWSIVDYYLRPKPAFYAIARELRRYTVGVSRKLVREPRDETTAAYFTETEQVEVWACNSTLQSMDVRVFISAFHLDGRLLDRRYVDATLAPNASTEVGGGEVPGQIKRTSESHVLLPIIVHAQLYARDSHAPATAADKRANGSGSGVLARFSSWPEPYKYLDLPDPGLAVDVDGERVRLACTKPAKAVVLDSDGDEDIDWSDQAIDLVPGDEQVVVARGLKGRVVLKYLGIDA
ncbi:hypothetical protein Q5752_004683 [Cryptotrichosporon argae]